MIHRFILTGVLSSTQIERRSVVLYYLILSMLGAKKTMSRSDPREGKRRVGGFYPIKVSQTMRRLAADEDISIQDLLRQMIIEGMEKRRIKNAKDLF